MAIATTSRRALSILNILRPVLKSIDRLPPKARPGLLGLMLFMVLSIVVLSIFRHESALLIGILGIASSIVVIATAGRRAPLFVVILLAFCIAIAILNGPRPAADTVIRAQEPVQKPVVDPDLKRPGATAGLISKDSAKIVGNIRYRGTNAAVQGAFVNVEGYGAGSDTTTATGYFEITVPRQFIESHRDSVTLAIETTQTTIYTAPYTGLPYHIALEPQAAPVARVAPRPASRAALAAFRATLPAPPAPGDQEGFRARLVLDSVKTLHDGSDWRTYWRFDVTVNGAHVITIPERGYDRRRGMLHLAGETTIMVDKPYLRLHIRGLRDAFIGVHQINGFYDVARDSLAPEQPVHLQLEVAHETNPNKGQFVFYYTLVRRGTPHIRVNAAAGST